MPTSDQRLARMRESFEEDRSVLAEDYAYFTTPHEPIRLNKAGRKLAEQSGRRSPKPSEKPSSDKTDPDKAEAHLPMIHLVLRRLCFLPSS